MGEPGNVIAAELAAATAAARAYANSTSYGTFISDEQCQNLAAVIVSAVDDARAKASAVVVASITPKE